MAGEVVGWARASNQPCGGNLAFLGVHPRKSQYQGLLEPGLHPLNTRHGWAVRQALMAFGRGGWGDRRRIVGLPSL